MRYDQIRMLIHEVVHIAIQSVWGIMRWLHSVIITIPGGILMLMGRPHCAIYPYHSYTVCMSVTEGKAWAFQAQIALIHDEQMLRADYVIGTISPEPEYNGYDKSTRTTIAIAI